MGLKSVYMKDFYINGRR